MTKLLKSKGILETKSKEGYGYYLGDEEQFSQLGYKVLLAQEINGLLKTTKVSYNGKIKLMYFVKDYKTCQTILSVLPFDSILMICSKILKTIVQIKENSFLFCENIDISIDHILFDSKTYEVQLIYLPLVSGDEIDKNKFNFELRQVLLQIVKMNKMAASQSELKMVEMLNDDRVDIERILKFTESFGKKTVEKADSLILVSMNPNLQLTFIVDKPYFTIGRRKDNDGVLGFWKEISRSHCSITYDRNSHTYFLEDEGSSYGTKLNKERLTEYNPKVLKDKDIIEFPGGIKFKVYLRKEIME